MNVEKWPETDEDGNYNEGADWVCTCCSLSQTISTEEMDPLSCEECGGPVCVDCRVDIGGTLFCYKCEEATRDEA